MPIRVLHVLPHLKPGGAERVAVHMIRGLDGEQFQVGALSLGPPSGSDLEQMLAESRIRVWYLGKHPGFDPRMFTRVYRVLRDFRPEIVHTHVHVLRYTLPSTLFRPAPVMLHTVHNVAENEVEPRAQWLQRLAFRRGGIKPVAVAAEVARSVARLHGVAGVEVVPNCIPVARYSRPRVARDAWREREGFAQDEALFVCVARFEPQKNHELLINAFAAGPGQHHLARLVLVGRGPLRDTLEQQVANAGLGGKVRFLGLRTDVPDVLAACDAFVLASDYEGNPLAVLEAMAAGLPVAATSAGGVPELVENGTHGCLVPPGDLHGLAGAMVELLELPEQRRRMGAAAAARARNEFDISRMVDAYAAIYGRLLRQAGLLPEHRSRAGSRLG